MEKNLTPQQKINTRAKEYAHFGDLHNPEENFKNGAEYGYNLAVEKAIDWLCRNMVDTDYWCINAQALMSKPELINNLKQAMKL